MRVTVTPTDRINEYRPSVTLQAENKKDRDTLRNIENLLPEIVVGCSRSEKTGETTILEIGNPSSRFHTAS